MTTAPDTKDRGRQCSAILMINKEKRYKKMAIIWNIVEGTAYRYGCYSDENRANEIALDLQNRGYDVWVELVEATAHIPTQVKLY